MPFEVVSHQSVLVDIRPLHLPGFSQRHGTTQDIQVLLQQKYTCHNKRI